MIQQLISQPFCVGPQRGYQGRYELSASPIPTSISSLTPCLFPQGKFISGAAPFPFLRGHIQLQHSPPECCIVRSLQLIQRWVANQRLFYNFSAVFRGKKKLLYYTWENTGAPMSRCTAKIDFQKRKVGPHCRENQVLKISFDSWNKPCLIIHPKSTAGLWNYESIDSPFPLGPFELDFLSLETNKQKSCLIKVSYVSLATVYFYHLPL